MRAPWRYTTLKKDAAHKYMSDSETEPHDVLMQFLQEVDAEMLFPNDRCVRERDFYAAYVEYAYADAMPLAEFKAAVAYYVPRVQQGYLLDEISGL
jgi:hypothetical protein